MDTYQQIFTPTGFSEQIFKERYAFSKDESWTEACKRLAHQMAITEKTDKVSYYEDKFYNIISNNLFVPGGRIWYQSGKNNPALLNCFVLTSDLDSKEGWGKLASEMIITSMSGGGCGIDFSDVRPHGAEISGNKGNCPGPVALMELIDNCAEPVKSGGGRRVALMFSLDLEHPDIEEFLDAKLTKGKLTHANVSIKCRNTKEFIKAVKNDGEIELSWKGSFKKKIKAKKLWDRIVENAYNSAEPGFLNWELVSEEHNLQYARECVSTNPCGEQCLPSYSNCCLGHLVLHRFIKDNEVDYELLGQTIRTAVRFLDNVLSVNQFPLQEMKVVSDKERRIGLGVTGLADMLAHLNIRYGSDESIKFMDRLFRFISKTSYEASIFLAVEKGSFPLFNAEKFLESSYMIRMTNKIKSLIREHGIRNCTILTVAPTGTVSILSGNCSSGIEPMFAPAYYRRYWSGADRKKELVLHPLFKQFMEEKRSVEHFVGAHELTVEEHLNIQKIIQKHIDAAISKTINISENYSIDDMKRLWLEYLPYLKGTTFYRENSRGYVNSSGEVEEPPLVPLCLTEAKALFDSEVFVVRSEIDCVKGVCEI